MFLVGLIADIYFGIRVHTTGFGSYRHLLIILILMQSAPSQLIIGAGIALTAVTGIENAYSQFEMAGVSSHWIHAASHVALTTGCYGLPAARSSSSLAYP